MTDNAIANRKLRRPPPYQPVYPPDHPLFEGEELWYDDYANTPRNDDPNAGAYDLTGMSSLHPDAQRDLVPMAMALRRSNSMRQEFEQQAMDRQERDERNGQIEEEDYALWMEKGKPGGVAPDFRYPGPGKWPGSPHKPF